MQRMQNFCEFPRILGNVIILTFWQCLKDFPECSRRFWGVLKEIPGNVTKDFWKCSRGFQRISDNFRELRISFFYFPWNLTGLYQILQQIATKQCKKNYWENFLEMKKFYTLLIIINLLSLITVFFITFFLFLFFLLYELKA